MESIIMYWRESNSIGRSLDRFDVRKYHELQMHFLFDHLDRRDNCDSSD